jgi:hypothetical protein
MVDILFNMALDLVLFIFTMQGVSCRLLPLYFPQDKHEEQVALSKLPADLRMKMVRPS